MTLRVPSNAEIHAKAVEFGVVAAGEQLTPAQRARAARAISDAEQAAAAAAGPWTAAPAARETLLSRSLVRVADGHLVVEVRHVPDPIADGATPAPPAP